MGKTLDLKPVDGSFSLKEHIYDVLKTSIMDLDIYDLDTNLRMDERTLAEKLGISRTPIREAIMRLEQEGFVEIAPRRGVFIKRKSLDEILEMITVWAALESMAARLACQHASDSEIAELRKIGTQFTKDNAKARLSEYLRQVKAGNEVVVTQRGVPIARLTGLEASERRATRRDRLAQAGSLKLGRGNPRPSLLIPPSGDPIGQEVIEALSTERDEAR